jgi:hypothetical protein
MRDCAWNGGRNSPTKVYYLEGMRLRKHTNENILRKDGESTTLLAILIKMGFAGSWVRTICHELLFIA